MTSSGFATNLWPDNHTVCAPRRGNLRIVLGSKSIAHQFLKLSKLYSEALENDIELNGIFKFKDLPCEYALIQQLGMALYEKLIDAGISFHNGNTGDVVVKLY